MIPTPLPDYPWQKVSSELFQLDGAQYNVVVYYYLRYPEVVKLPTTSYLQTNH